MYAYLILFMGLGMNEIIIIALVVLLLFGGKKIPELMNGLGKGVKSFKDGMNGESSTKEDGKPDQLEGQEQTSTSAKETQTASSAKETQTASSAKETQTKA